MESKQTFPCRRSKAKKKKIKSKQTLQEIKEAARKKEEFEQGTSDNLERRESTRKEIILEADLEQAKREIIDQNEEKNNYVQKHYTVSTLSEDVLKTETRLPTKEVFHIVSNYADRFKQSINHFSGWRVQSISFEDQIFITLMKVRQNYTNLHLA